MRTSPARARPAPLRRMQEGAAGIVVGWKPTPRLRRKTHCSRSRGPYMMAARGVGLLEHAGRDDRRPLLLLPRQLVADPGGREAALRMRPGKNMLSSRQHAPALLPKRVAHRSRGQHSERYPDSVRLSALALLAPGWLVICRIAHAPESAILERMACTGRRRRARRSERHLEAAGGAEGGLTFLG